MAEHHGLRSAFRTGCKQNDRFFVAAFLMGDALDFIAQERVDFFPQADFFCQFFQINDMQAVSFQNFNQIFHLCGFDESH